MVKKETKKSTKTLTKVSNFEPTKMSLAVATIAGVSLVVFAVLAVYA